MKFKQRNSVVAILAAACVFLLIDFMLQSIGNFLFGFVFETTPYVIYVVQIALIVGVASLALSTRFKATRGAIISASAIYLALVVAALYLLGFFSPTQALLVHFI